MRVGSGLLEQLERCGLSAKLAGEHCERGEDKHGFRDVRTEIARAWAAQDQATLPEAEAAMRWLMAEAGEVVSVGEPLDLVDDTTGEVLVTGRAGAVVVTPDAATVVAWHHADEHDTPEPEDDLGLVALGLGAAKGRPFRLATVALRELEAFPRRSRVFAPEQHAALLARIKAAVSQPRVARPGDWCGACRQRFHCPAWEARSKLALAVFDRETQVRDGVDSFRLEITNENAGALAMRLKAIKEASELAEEQLKAFVRSGGRCVANGKEYYLGQRDGRKTADIDALERDGLDGKYVKQGEPFEMPGWRKVRP